MAEIFFEWTCVHEDEAETSTKIIEAEIPPAITTIGEPFN